MKTYPWPQVDTRNSVDTSSRGSVRVEPVRTAYEMLEALDIRKKVFVDEQGVDLAEEYDGQDRYAIHVLAYADDKAVGTLRVLREGDVGKVGRFAVLREYRGRGVGRELLGWVIRSAPSLGLRKLILNAQTQAADFYRKAGFTESGPEFVEAGIRHVPMERPL